MRWQNRGRMYWTTVAAIVIGMSLIGWVVEDVLSWLQKTALVIGVGLLAYGMATGYRSGRDTSRESSGSNH